MRSQFIRRCRNRIGYVYLSQKNLCDELTVWRADWIPLIPTPQSTRHKSWEHTQTTYSCVNYPICYHLELSNACMPDSPTSHSKTCKIN